MSPIPPQAYWRSCAALLGQVLETAFKDDFAVELLSTPEVPGIGASLCVSKFTLTSHQTLVDFTFGHYITERSARHCQELFEAELRCSVWSLLVVCYISVKTNYLVSLSIILGRFILFIYSLQFLCVSLQSLQVLSVVMWCLTLSWTHGLPLRCVFVKGIVKPLLSLLSKYFPLSISRCMSFILKCFVILYRMDKITGTPTHYIYDILF